MNASPSRVGPRMAQVVAYVEAHPECSLIDCARYVAPERFGRIGLSFGYKSVHRAVKAGLIDTRPHPNVRGRVVLVPVLSVPPVLTDAEYAQVEQRMGWTA